MMNPLKAIVKQRFPAAVHYVHYREEQSTRRRAASIAELPPSTYRDGLCRWYVEHTGNTLDLDNPQTFNEKIQWLKLFASTPEIAQLTDKYAVRSFVSHRLGEQYLVPIHGVWEDVDDIVVDDLPTSFVLKATHASGTNLIVSDKARVYWPLARKRLRCWLETRFAFANGYELHYDLIAPRIVSEQLLTDSQGPLVDYKFMCIEGEVRYISVHLDRENDHRRAIHDVDWKPLPFRIGTHAHTQAPRPDHLGEMMEAARALSQGFSQVRVDLYDVGGKVYFGELTFTTSSGLSEFSPPEYGRTFGSLLVLPPKHPFRGEML